MPAALRRTPRARTGAWLALALAGLVWAGCGETRGTVPVLGTEEAGRAKAERERARPVAAPKPRIIEHGPRRARRVALTFDADMTEAQLAQMRAGTAATDWYDREVIRELRRTRTPATLFMAGLWVKAHPGPARRLARSELFEIENHSLNHRAFELPCFGLPAVGSARRKRLEVTRSSDVIESVTGVRPRYFRFPGGCYSKSDVRLVARAGEQPLGWDVISTDVGQPDGDLVREEVLGRVKPGSIVVMHMNGPPNAPGTAEALPGIISGLRERGLEPVKLEDLLASGR